MLTAIEDYTHISESLDFHISESLDFGVGEVQACIDITIMDDDILEPVFTVELDTFSDFVDIRTGTSQLSTCLTTTVSKHCILIFYMNL